MRRADVLILTAIKLEYLAVLQVGSSDADRRQWTEETGPTGLPVALRSFSGKGGRSLRVVVAQAGDMGAVAATNTLLRLVEIYRPRCIAMCGVCAGHPDKTRLGDVIAAERLFFHDTGKQLPERVQQDLETYILRDDWKIALEHFDFAARFRSEAWWKSRPLPYEWQENWVLAKLREGVEDPASLPERIERCPQWEKVIEALWASGHVEDGTLSLTGEGRKRINRLLIKHGNSLPDTSPSGALVPFKVHVAPMGSGSKVVEDKAVWGTISEYMRKTLGLEMEAAAIGALAHAQLDWQLDTLVMKGVMDFANHGRDDHFKEFAARASAECLLAFLRENLEVETVPGLDDLLVSGTAEKLPEKSPPSALLSACYEVVPFHQQGRVEILADLDRWCDEGPPVAVRLLHAEGGVGKTRLAIEWVRRRRAMGWASGFLPKGVNDDWFERLWSLGKPVLVVLDYAESRAGLPEMLTRIFRYSQQKHGGVLRHMRLLLLARNAGDWWQSLLKPGTALGEWLGATPAIALRPLAMEKVERETVFHAAAEKFAKVRGRVLTKRASPSLSDKRFERVLYLHMAALAFVDGLPFAANELMDVILDHEECFWGECAQQTRGMRLMQQSLARQMVAAATLRGRLVDSSMAATVAARIFGRTLSFEDEALLRLLQMIYHREGEHSSVFLPSLEPDLLGEGMVLRVAAPKLQGDRLPADWIDRLFPPDEEAQMVRTGLEVLGRASAAQPDVARPWLERLLAGPLKIRALLALDGAKAIGFRTELSVLGDVLADRLEADGDVNLAREMDSVGIPVSTVSLRRVAEWASRMLLQSLPEPETELELVERVRLLNIHGIRLSELGRYEDALEAIRKAVELLRSLGQGNSDKFWFDLAMSLNNLGTRLSALGRHEEALRVTREAVEINRALAKQETYAFRPEFAMSLNNLGTLLCELGRREDALDVVREAVKLLRPLARINPNVFLSHLAMCLTNEGTLLSDLGQHEKALDATHEAVGLYLVLAQQEPDAFRPVLASVLNSLGNRLSDLGRHEDALDATSQSVELRRPLAQRNPDAFQPDLASSLAGLGTKEARKNKCSIVCGIQTMLGMNT